MGKKLLPGLILMIFLLFSSCSASPLLPTAGTDTPTEKPSQETEIVNPQPFSGGFPAVNFSSLKEDFAAGLSVAEAAKLDSYTSSTFYQIEIHIAEDYRSLTGHETVTYTNRQEKALNEIVFLLYPNRAGGESRISTIQIDGQSVEARYGAQNFAMHLPLPQPLQPAAQIKIDMDFFITIPIEMSGNYGLFGYFDNILVLDEFYPLVARYFQGNWNDALPSSVGDVTANDVSFYQVQVTAPKNLVLVASGVQRDQEEEGDLINTAYVVGPARDFYLAGSPLFQKVSKTIEGITFNSYYLPGGEDAAQYALDTAVDAVKVFNTRLGSYAYQELDILSTPMQALGMEYPGLVDISLEFYNKDPHDLLYGLPVRDLMGSVIAHETGHQWFYNMVGGDQQQEPWLDESLTQYITGLYMDDRWGKQAGIQYRLTWTERWERVDKADIPIGLPVGQYTPDNYSPIVYGRGPLFIAALAEEVGQDIFDQFLKDYFKEYQWKIATGVEFKTLLEEHCNCDLTPIFEEWVY